MDTRPIQRLSDEVIGQIAAGEVVERPAAAVKELVENSIDAGATAVTVELQDGGITSIRVSDNGAGIPAKQIRMAFERHATSKLVKAEELYDVHTLGFRGEALASIAAVAKVTCVTRTTNADYGIRAQVEAGEFAGVIEAASPVGTSITVRDLFFNAPVRLKFLKKPASEATFVSDYIMRLILSRPDVAFRFVNQGKTVYRSAGDGTLESALYCVYGREALKTMRRVQGSEGGVLVDGYVGIGELARGNRMQQSFFINGRYFRDDLISKALENGCEGYVMIGRYPMCAMYLQMPYRQVDVNVHPNKLEVRFQNPPAVVKAVETLTHAALGNVTVQDMLTGAERPRAATVVPEIEVVSLPGGEGREEAPPEPEEQKPGEANILFGAADDARMKTPTLRQPAALARDDTETLLQPEDNRLIRETAETYAPDEDGEAYTVFAPKAERVETVRQETENAGIVFSLPARPVAGTETATVSTAEQQSFTGKAPVNLRYIGVAFKTFLLFEAGDRLLMVDQHAAHERVLYDRFMKRYEETRISQQLLTPQTVRLTVGDVSRLIEMGEELTEAGFDIDAFDASTVAVRAIPVILGQNEPVRDLLLDVLDETRTRYGKVTRERLRRRVAQMACKHAIKGGDILGDDDVKALLTQMLET
ncbi:MAG: DNA mismatch repair endonuclease MutL, partial [Eubacteriales bacterium]|nr:DNA mismatch repair endonuclease MutL [Eubacteriales bacterium]